jgi:hypothetical protein
LGLISNHRLAAEDQRLAAQYSVPVRYWDDLVSFLERESLCEPTSLMPTYVAYARRSCAVTKINRARFDAETLQSLGHFNNLIRKIIGDATHDDFAYQVYAAPRAFSPTWFGQYYCLTDKRWGKPLKGAYPFFGLAFESEPAVCIWLDHDWNTPAIEPLRRRVGSRYL